MYQNALGTSVIATKGALKTIINNTLKTVEINDGWVNLYLKNNKEDVESLIHAILVPSEAEVDTPFPIQPGRFNFPTVEIGNPEKEWPAKIFVIEIKDPRKNVIMAELNQEVKLQMALFSENNSSYFELKNDMSSSEVITIYSDQFERRYLGKWSSINDYLQTYNQYLIIQFIFAFKCSSELIEEMNKNGGYKLYKSTRKNLLYQREVIEYNGTIRISGRKIFKKKLYRRNRKYYFSIGYHKDGSIKYHVVNKDTLRNQLQCVFFDRRVLAKYEQNQYFLVEPMQISCCKWNLQICNEQKNIISVLLVHLESLLPDSEYTHWMSYNILLAPYQKSITPGELSTIASGIPHEPERVDHIFKEKLNSLHQTEVNDLSVLKKLNNLDVPYFNTLCLISEESQWHFDVQILNLSKVLNESIDREILKKHGIADFYTKNCKTCNEIINISRSNEDMLKDYLLAYGANETEVIDCITSLSDIKKFRNAVAHRRKTKSYYNELKWRKKYGESLSEVLEGLFKHANKLIELILSVQKNLNS